VPLGTEIFYVKNSIRLHNKYNPDVELDKEEKLIKIADLDEESS
jgi:GTPase